MSALLEVGSPVTLRFPGNDHTYECEITEQHPPKKNGDVERYRIKGSNLDCFAFRHELTAR